MSRQDARTLIDKTINENKIVVFSKSFCPYCRKAKSALYRCIDAAKVHILEIENRPDMDAIQDELLDMTGGRSVPRVFIDGEFIGGGDETAAMASNGSLQKLLETKGIA